MTKNDLKTGMIVEINEGTRYLVLKEDLNTTWYGKQNLMFINELGFMNGSDYNDDLFYVGKYGCNITDYNIDKVFTKDITGLNFMVNNNEHINLIWERGK